MKKIISPKVLYITLLFIMPLLPKVIKPTYSKFTQTITTDEDIVNINTNVNLSINSVNEYKNITVGSKDYEVYKLEIRNTSDKPTYYELWHSIEKETLTNEVTVSYLKDKDLVIKEQLEPLEVTTIPLIIRNNSNKSISINIGVLFNEKSKEEISFNDNQKKIEREDYEANIYYDNVTNKYYYSLSNTEVTFPTEETSISYKENYQTYTAPLSGYYKIQLWGAKTTKQSGDYLSSDVYLKKNQSVYIYTGKTYAEGIESETSLRLIPSKIDNEASLNSRLLIAGNDTSSTYIYNYERNKKDNSYELEKKINYNLKPLKNNIIMEKTNLENGYATIAYLENQQPTVEGLKYIYKNTDYKLENIICKDNGKGCTLVKVRPSTTKDLDTGIYEITYIVKDNDNITYKYQSTFEIIEKE